MPKTNKSIPVIIFGGGIAGYGVVRALAPYKIPLYLVASDKKSICRVSRYIRKTLVLNNDNPDFILKFSTWTQQNIGEKAVLMIAGDDDYLDVLSKNYDRLFSGFKATFPSWEIVKLVREKRHAYKITEQLGIPVPRTYYVISKQELEDLFKKGIEAKFPLLMKSEYSKLFLNKYKTKGIVCNSRGEVLRNYDKYDGFLGSLLLQEMIPGGEENLYCLKTVLNKDSRPLGVFVDKKIRSSKQFCSCTLTSSTWSDEVVQQGLELVKRIGYVGYVSVEFKFDQRDKLFKLMEINGRISMNNSHALKCGINFPYLIYQNTLNGFSLPLDEVRQMYRDNYLWWYVPGDIVALYNLIKTKSFNLSKCIRAIFGRGYIIEPMNWRDPLPGIMSILGIVKRLLPPFPKSI